MAIRPNNQAVRDVRVHHPVPRLGGLGAVARMRLRQQGADLPTVPGYSRQLFRFRRAVFRPVGMGSVQRVREGGGLHPVADADLAQNVGDVHAGGLGAYEQLGADLCVGPPGRGAAAPPFPARPTVGIDESGGAASGGGSA